MGVGEAMKIPLVEAEDDTAKLQVAGPTSQNVSASNEQISSVSSHASYEEGAGSTIIVQDNNSSSTPPPPSREELSFSASGGSGEDPYESLDQFG